MLLCVCCMLPKKYKIRKKNDFKVVFDGGVYKEFNFIRVKFINNNLNISRFGFIISSKISKKAVERNKIRRQLEEVISLNYNSIKQGLDVVVMVKPEITNKQNKEIRDTLLKILEKSQIIKK